MLNFVIETEDKKKRLSLAVEPHKTINWIKKKIEKLIGLKC